MVTAKLATTLVPAVLIVYERTSALDQERGTRIVDLLLRLTAEHGTATVLVTHEPRILPDSAVRTTWSTVS